jgi:hypothetical protein
MVRRAKLKDPRPLCDWCGVSFKSEMGAIMHRNKSAAGKLVRCHRQDRDSSSLSYHVRTSSDNYETPLWAWEELFAAMPALRRKLLWDPFYCKGGTSGHWDRLRISRFVHGRGDFFRQVKRVRYDVVVTNPPFSSKKIILATLVDTGKPFVVLLRTSVLFTKWFRKLVPTFKLVLPSAQVDFKGTRGQALSFGCVFVCVGCGPRTSLYACPV